MENIYQGQIVSVNYEEKQIKGIVIDPNGLGEGKPSIGMGLTVSENYLGISHQALSKRVATKEDEEWLKLPSGKLLRVATIPAEDGNTYKVLEFKDWVEAASDFIDQSFDGKSRLNSVVLRQMLQFVRWFAVKGIYAASYVQLKGAYSASDDDTLSSALSEANERLIADNVVLKLQCDRAEAEKNQLLYQLDAIRETNANSSGTHWKHWELEETELNF